MLLTRIKTSSWKHNYDNGIERKYICLRLEREIYGFWQHEMCVRASGVADRARETNDNANWDCSMTTITEENKCV